MLAPLSSPGESQFCTFETATLLPLFDCIFFSDSSFRVRRLLGFFPSAPCGSSSERISREIPTETSDKPPSKFIDFLSFPIAFSRTSVLVGGCLRPRVLQPHTVEQCRHASLRRFHGSEPNKKRPVALKKTFHNRKIDQSFQSSILCSRKWKISLRTLTADKTAFSLECLLIRISRALCLLFTARVRTKRRRPSLIPRRRNFLFTFDAPFDQSQAAPCLAKRS